MLLEWKNWRNKLVRSYLQVVPVWKILGDLVPNYHKPTFHNLHIGTFQMVQKSPQLELVWESYASQKLTIMID